MTHHGLTVADLARRCREETLRFLRSEPRDDTFCFELFERAIAHREPDAWEAIMIQYRGRVLAYVGQHSAATVIREVDDYWVNRAFQRFWMAVQPDRFGQFRDLPGLLKYLKLCVHSVLLDEVRARRAGSTTSLDEVPEEAPGSANAEETVLGELAAQQLWQAIAQELQDEPERVVAFLSFARDLKPAEIYSRHPTLYESVADVYRVKRNVIERLRRSPQVRAFLVETA
jgi:DNA-directed RNA polymerase specialized sigma24 family protein